MTPAFAVGADAGRSLLQNIGRYQIESELGKGAMGLVYKATDPNIGRAVALKTMRLDVHGIEQEEMLRRFKNEARSAGVLNHPNIVTIYDAGEDQGLFYIAMEYIEGKTLAELLQQHRVLPVDQVVSITRNVCSGLDFAHSKGIVHRDIKPANIMVTPAGTAKIMDFGIAKVSGSMTSTGQVLGTPNYMSPEQVKGRQLDGRSDLFSLGVMLYEMLTGEKPFLGQGVTTIIYKIVNENPIPPRDLDLTIHPGLSAVVTRTLAKDPYERYQTGAELIRDLENYKSYGADGNSTMVSSTGAFDRAAITGDSDATLIGTSPAVAKAPTPVAAPTPMPATTQPAAERTTPIPQPAASTGGASASTPVPPAIPAAVADTRSETVSQKIAAAGSHGLGKLLIGAFAVLVLIAGIVGISRHNARKRAADNGQQEFQQAMQQAQQAMDMAKKAEQLGENAVPSDSSANTAPATNTAPQPPSKDSSAAPATPKADSAEVPTVPSARNKKEAADAKPTVGTVKLASTPAGADVTVDGQPADHKTPAILNLPPGDHVIKLHKDGFQDETQNVTVAMGQTQNVVSKLKESAVTGASTASEKPSAPAKESNPFAKIGRFFRGGGGSDLGTLAVATTPSGAKVIVNGEANPTPTPVSIQTKAGKYKLQLVMDGYKTIEREVTVEKGKSTGIAEILVHK